MSELGPASQALLERVNETFGFVEIGTLISWAKAKTGFKHADAWWWRRLVVLALEGRIESKVYRNGDRVAIRFRRLRNEDTR